MRFRNVVATLLMILFASAGIALAQETTGKVEGTIVDSQGVALPGVTVTVTGTQGAKTTADARFHGSHR